MSFRVNPFSNTNPGVVQGTTTHKPDANELLFPTKSAKVEQPKTVVNEALMQELTTLLEPDPELYNSAPNTITLTENTLPLTNENIKGKTPAGVEAWVTEEQDGKFLNDNGTYYISFGEGSDRKVGGYNARGQLVTGRVNINGEEQSCILKYNDSGKLLGFEVTINDDGYTDFDNDINISLKTICVYNSSGELAYIIQDNTQTRYSTIDPKTGEPITGNGGLQNYIKDPETGKWIPMPDGWLEENYG